MKRSNTAVGTPPRLYQTVGSIPPEEIRPLREIHKLGYEYFWVKVFDAWPWMVAQRHVHPDKKIDGKAFYIGETKFSYSRFLKRPAIGLDPPFTGETRAGAC